MRPVRTHPDRSPFAAVARALPQELAENRSSGLGPAVTATGASLCSGTQARLSLSQHRGPRSRLVLCAGGDAESTCNS